MHRRTYKRKSKTLENVDESPKTPKVDNELVVTGVSRSGRVRKKSSKLLGYDSGAEDDRARRKLVDNSVLGNPTERIITHKKQTDNQQNSIDYQYNEEVVNVSNDSQQIDSEPETNTYAAAEGFNDSSVDSSGTELDDDLLNQKLRVEPPATHTEISYPRSEPTPAVNTSQKSLYMIEKFSKKRKNGRPPKAGRKDKGKARFSAYMLWAKEVRPDLMKANPNIGSLSDTLNSVTDFSQLSSKLSDLWATVPYTDKYMWKQKAKRMAMSARNSDTKEEANVQKAQIKTTLTRKYINKKAAANTTPSTNKGISVAQKTKKQQILTEVANPVVANPVPATDNKASANESISLKKVSTQPLDVAAHLKLLGESLSIIGQRLKEHEGQIAVSGSLSVLLDTLLCSLGPLLCLTQQVEEMNGCSKETLSGILDNIAYIMPGL